MIAGVAVKFGDFIEVRMPAPNRHCHCFWHFREVCGEGNKIAMKLPSAGLQQGFYTDKGVFLDRFQAYRHAKRCKQLLPTTDNRRGPLFSEDVW